MRGALAGLGIALLAGGGAWYAWRERHPFRLPARIVFEERLADLSAAFDRSVVVTEPAAAPVRMAGLQPGDRLDWNGTYRRALVTPPPSTLRFRLDAPPGARLRFAVAVERAAGSDAEAAGVRFTASVDGRPLFARTVNPDARGRDRRWFDERLDLGITAEREVDMVLATEADGSGRPAGTAGWSHVRLVRERQVPRQPAAPGRPNVLVLLVDTLRADHVGCHGAHPSPTPTLDDLAARALVFEQAIGQASWTMPSVASIFTGLLPMSHGVTGRGETNDGGDGDPAFLADGLLTIAEQVQAAGISTVAVVANSLVSRGTNMVQGFETFVALDPADGHGRWARAAEVNATFMRWLRQNRRHRFFAYLHYMDVHGPYEAPAPFRPVPPDGVRPAVAGGRIAALARKLNAHEGQALTAAELAHLSRLYTAGIRYWDSELAGLLAALAAEGVLDSTAVIVTADHGEEFQEHGKLEHTIHLYDELIRVPLVIAAPSVAPARVAAQAQGIDLFPTVTALLGVPTPPGLPGQDLLGPREPRPAVSETRWGLLPDGRTEAMVAVRTPAWKLIRAPHTGHVEVYDLARDPAERNDLSGRVPEGEQLVSILERLRAKAPPPPVPEGRDPHLRDKLRALGYID